MEFLYYKLTSV